MTKVYILFVCSILSHGEASVNLRRQVQVSTPDGAQMQMMKLPPYEAPTETWMTNDQHLAEMEAARIHGHHLYAVTILCFMMTVVGAFAMVSSSNKAVSTNTWSVIDTVCVVLMATSLFFMINHLFDELLHGPLRPYYLLAHVLYAITLFFLAVFGGWMMKLQGNDANLKAFNATIFWVVLLAKGGALTEAQQELGQSLLHVAMISFGSLFFFAILIFITHKMKPEADPTWYDDSETGLVGGAFAGGFVTMVNMMIAGTHEHDDKAGHTDPAEKWLGRAFCVTTVVVAVIASPVLGDMISTAQKDGKYWYSRFLSFLNSFQGVLPYFTMSVGGGGIWCDLLGVVHPSKMSHVVGAMMGGIYGAGMIFACAYIPYLQREDTNTKSLVGLITGFGGFIAGAGWAGLIVEATGELPEGRGYSSEHRFRMRLMTIILVNAVVLPTYVLYLKPTVIRKTA